MKADKTDKLIAQAIAALPYRGPRAGFAARVMAQIAAAPAPAWYVPLLKPAGLLVAGWGAMVGFALARLLWTNAGAIAAALLQPGGATHAVKLAGGHAALAAAKLVSGASYAAGFLPGLPAWHETAIATLACSFIIAALAKGARASAAKAGI
jgi:hypothetical protein